MITLYFFSISFCIFDWMILFLYYNFSSVFILTKAVMGVCDRIHEWW